jgi:hypothetical protein
METKRCHDCGKVFVDGDMTYMCCFKDCYAWSCQSCFDKYRQLSEDDETLYGAMESLPIITDKWGKTHLCLESMTMIRTTTWKSS